MGVDMCVSPERVILLDTQVCTATQLFISFLCTLFLTCEPNRQPILSPSILFQMLDNDYPLPADISSYENLQDLQSLQLAVLIFSICHIVILVHDWTLDIDLWKFIRSVEMLKYRIPDVAAHMATLPDDHTEQTEYYPEMSMNNLALPSITFLICSLSNAQCSSSTSNQTNISRRRHNNPSENPSSASFLNPSVRMFITITIRPQTAWVRRIKNQDRASSSCRWMKHERALRYGPLWSAKNAIC